MSAQTSGTPAEPISVTDALYGRISTRSFLPTPLTIELLTEILDAARWSPSGGNLQPWKVVAVSGVEKDALTQLGRDAFGVNPRGEEGDRPMYPKELWEPHRTYRYQVGEEMYAKLGIPREDKAARFTHVARNFEFFGAPVGLFFVIDERMGHGQWAHLGMFMQSIALAAYERGVSSCFQEFWALVRETLKTHFELGETEMVYCGMALGFADPEAPVNSLRSTRAEVRDFTTFRGF
jgi:nitroreductase